METPKDSGKDTIEFVSYDGAYPCLCMGTLVLKINGENVSFGLSKDKCDHGRFWRSGGSVSFDRDWHETVTSGPWEYHEWPDTPDAVKRNHAYIMQLFNEHVHEGCCGGCV